MAKNNKNNKKGNKNNKEKETKKFVNPASRLWGKILIAILAVAMALGGLISLILYFVTGRI